jgi:uncharacterized protein YkwD
LKYNYIHSVIKLLPVCFLSFIALLVSCSTVSPTLQGNNVHKATYTSSSKAQNLSIEAQSTTQPTVTATVPTTVTSSSEIATEQNQFAMDVFNAINSERATAGLSALKWSDALVRSAHAHNLQMVAAQTLSHQLPNEADLFTRVRAQGITTYNIAENIAYTYDRSSNGAVGLEVWMLAEKPPDDGHRLNILTTVGTAVGVDVVTDSQRLWLTEDFAQV